MKDFIGNFSEYLDCRREEKSRLITESSAKNASNGVDVAVVDKQNQKGSTAKAKKMSNKERMEYESLLANIDDLGKRQEKLEKLLADGQSDYNKLTKWTDELVSHLSSSPTTKHTIESEI